MSGIDQNAVLEQASHMGWAVFLLVFIILVISAACGIFFTTWWVRVAIPESKKRVEFIERMAVTNEQSVLAKARMSEVIERLSRAAEAAQHNADARHATINGTLNRGCAYAHTLCDTLESIAQKLPMSDRNAVVSHIDQMRSHLKEEPS